MKRVLFLFFITLFVSIIFAEGLEVLSFEEDPYDIRGFVNPIKDANGDNCALIRIEHNLSGDVHLIDVEVFKRQKEAGNVVYFYISKWEKAVTITTEKYLPCKYSMPENLEPERTYVLTLFGSGEGEDINNIGVTITTEPAGATVYINNVKLAKKTPSGDFFVAGTYPIRIELADYQIFTTEIEILPPEVEKHYVLKPDFGTIEIVSEPEVNMEVFLNDVKVGKTPLTLKRQISGTYKLRAEHELYVAEEQEFDLKPEEHKRISVKAIQNFGTLTIYTLPGAKVYLNDELISEYKNLRLVPQTLNMKVELAKHHPAEKRQILNSGDKLEIDLMPEPITGTVLVTPDPIDAQILLTGDSGERFTDSGISKFADIPVGQYKIEITHPQHLNYEETFILEEGKVKKIAKTLSKAEMYFTLEIPHELMNDLSITLLDKNGKTVKLHKTDNRYLVEKAGRYKLNLNKGKNTLYTRNINITSQKHPEIVPYYKTYFAPSDGSELYSNGRKIDEGKNLLLISDKRENKVKFKIPKYSTVTINDTLTTNYNSYRLEKYKDYFRKKYGIGLIPDKEAVFYGIRLPIIYSPDYKKMYGFEINPLIAGNVWFYDDENSGDFNGVAIGGLFAAAGNFNGLAIGGFMAGADYNFNGIAMGTIANYTGGKHAGIQIGLVNYADKLKGVQIGVINIVKDGLGGAMPFFPLINVHF
ncbi:MAG: PEGA domain-containing protein [Candidatus Cloacimonetes bacterium]|nr:PEGA domain-containing protein [Candidatus Cloacimonadota bacterium]